MSNVAHTLTSFQAKMPGFKDWVCNHPNAVTEALDEAWREIEPSRYGQRASDAQAYLTAHLLTLNPPDGSGGTDGDDVVSVGAGPARVQFFKGSGGDADEYDSTRFGRRFKALRKLTGGVTLVNGAGFTVI